MNIFTHIKKIEKSLDFKYTTIQKIGMVSVYFLFILGIIEIIGILICLWFPSLQPIYWILFKAWWTILVLGILIGHLT